MQDSPAGAFRPAGVVFGDFVPPAQDDPGDISSNSPRAPRATSEDSPRKPADRPDRKQSSADDSRGEVVSDNWPDCKLVVEGDKGQAKHLLTVRTAAISHQASPEENGRYSFPLEALRLPLVRFWPKKMSSLCADCRLQNHQIFSWESEWVLSRLRSSA